MGDSRLMLLVLTGLLPLFSDALVAPVARLPVAAARSSPMTNRYSITMSSLFDGNQRPAAAASALAAAFLLTAAPAFSEVRPFAKREPVWTPPADARGTVAGSPEYLHAEPKMTRRTAAPATSRTLKS